MRNQFTIWLFILLPGWAAAQRASYSFRNITINQGLSQNSVIDIATDDAGFVWMATQDGLNRYDGASFLLFSKTFDDATSPTYSRLGKVIRGNGHYLWLITSGGVLEKFNLYNDSATVLTTLPGGIKLPPVSSLLQGEKGALWIGTETQGFFYYDSAAHTTTHYTKAAGSPVLLTSDSIQSIFKTHDNQYWVMTSNGMNRITPGKRSNTRWLYKATGPVISCNVMEEDKAGNLWMGTYGKGVYLKRTGDTAFTPFNGFGQQEILPTNLVVQTIREDAQGRIWVGTLREGVYIINTNDRSVRNLRPDARNPFSISYKDILCIQPGRQGSMWIGTDGNGVSYYDKRLNIFTLLSKSTLPENVPIEQVRSITTDMDGGIWIGTSSSGLSWSPDVRDNNAYQAVSLKGYSDKGRVVSLLTDREDTWVGMQDNGLLILDRKTRHIKASFTPQASGRHYLPDHTIWCMLAVNDTQAWLGTRNAGLCLFDKQLGLLKNHRYSADDGSGIADNNIRVITRINDSVLCLGFENKGVQFFDTRTGHFFLPQKKAFQQLAEEKPALKCLYYDYPLLWIGTLGKGIIVLNVKDGNSFRIDEKKGLPNKTIYSIVKDQQGNLWMSTNGGLCRFRPPVDLNATNRAHFSLYTAEDGLQGNEFNTGASYAGADGMLYFGGINGLNWFAPVNTLSPVAPARVVITKAAINNEPWKGDTGITYKKQLRLSYDQNSLSFNFAALDFVSPGKLTYYYRLLNYDRHWIDAGNRNYAAYTNLPPGEYVFEVSAEGKTVNKDRDIYLVIVITPPFWKTWWFIGLCVLALATLLYLFYRYRINQLIELQKVRNRIATDLHDEIGSTLTNISILSELSKQKLGQQEEAQVFLGRIAEEVSNSSQALDDIVWSINTNNDTLEQTVARMRRYAAEIFDGANIHYALHLDEQFAQRKLNMELRRDCFLLFKEAINNIYKHADAKNVTIRLWLDRGQLFMTIEDDGKGFDTTRVTHRNGLKNMQQRVKRWEGKISIRSEEGKGTFTQIYLAIT
jgi:ligand-binding sensor domain-containing protein/two-component sensor histidine kinase